MVKVFASQPRYYELEPHTGHDHDFSYDTSTGWFKEGDWRVVKISCENLIHNLAKKKFKLNYAALKF